MAEFTEFPLNLNSGEEKIADGAEVVEQEGKTKKGFFQVRAEKMRADALNWVPNGKIDLTFLFLILILLAVGLVMLLSASYASSSYETLRETGVAQPAYYFRKQVLWALIGVAVLSGVSFIPMSLYKKFAELAMLVSVALLIAVKLKGLGANGATRWFVIGPFNFQPSEIAKAAMIVCFAKWSTNLGPNMRTGWGFLPFILTIGLLGALLIIEPHLSATLIIFGVGLIMMWVGGTRWYWFILVAFLTAVGYWFVQNYRDVLLSIAPRLEYIYTRLDAWMYTYDREKVTRDQAWQIIQSLNAVGSGGLLGLGFGQSRQKFMYLPEEHNDYIFAIICEELGFIGAALILLLFAILIIRGYWLALHCKNIFTRMIIVGFVSLLALQVVLNVAVVTNTLPATGISLPFFSYGGTALILQMGEMGIVLSASREISDK